MVFMFIIAMLAAVVVATVMWRALSRQDGQQPPARPSRPSRPRPVAPDDDPDFLRRLGERLRSEGEDPPARR